MAQQDAAPKAAAMPPAANTAGPTARNAVWRTAGTASDFFASIGIAHPRRHDGLTLHSVVATDSSRDFCGVRHGSTGFHHHRRAIAAYRLQY